jgi:hypothetical protein
MVLQSGYLHADETAIKVMDRDKKGTVYKVICEKYRFVL